MAQLLEWLPWTAAGSYAIGALVAAASRKDGWPALRAATRVALAAALVACASAIFSAAQSQFTSGVGAAPIVALLVAVLGWVIGAYAHRYLQGEPGQRRFTIAYLATLAAVSTVVSSNHLAVLIGAWAASSAGLHHLLTFYRERPAAILVAHKKFLASRGAEALLVIAASLLFLQWGTLDIAALSARAQAAVALPPLADAAAVLIAAAVLLKSAQLPLHGWLIQVMEAPTPVSALLHAGVVNLGGFVLIRLAPLLGASPGAQALLVIVGSLTAALAGLVMLTRVTIKVRLAWSTCSQMGLMMLECGLGLYDLALLHLLAHALYKAHAFLTSGDAMRDSLDRQPGGCTTADGAARRSLLWPVLALPTAWLLAAGSALLWHEVLGLPQVSWSAIALLGFGLATLLWPPCAKRPPTGKALVAAAAGAQLYLLWHGLIARYVGVIELPASPVLTAWALLVFLGLYVAQAGIWLRRRTASAGRLYDWVYAGFYLDERFTRLAFRLWPVPR